MTDTFTRVSEILREQAIAAAEITPEAKLIDDLALDSLDRLELTLRCEEEFDVDLSDGDALDPDHLTVGDVVAFIDRKLGECTQEGQAA